MTPIARLTALTTVSAALVAGTAALAMGSAVARPASPGASRRQPAPSHQAAATHSHRAGHPAVVRSHLAAVSAGQQASVRHYWTTARMEHAIPLRPAATTRSGPAAPARQALMRAQAGQPASPAGALLGSIAGQAGNVVGSVTGLTGQAGTAGQAAGTQGRATGTQGRATGAPVTRARQRGAQGVTVLPMAATSAARWATGGAVARTTGKVFFTLGGADYVCSGSVVSAAGSDVVATAAHCVNNGGGTAGTTEAASGSGGSSGWATNWTFVPGYSGGNDPYGSYTARQFFVASQWTSQGDNDYDVAFVTVNPANMNGVSVPVQQETGGQGIKFGSRPSTVTVFGYPSDPPYNGEQLYYCGGKTSGDPYSSTTDRGVRCALTAGTSGGPWLSSFNRASGTGVITSVSSFKYSTSNHLLYGPLLGSTAQSLYQDAENS